MNKCYRLVFDEARGVLVPVAESKAARRKGHGRSCAGAPLRAVALLLASLESLCWPGTALAGGPPGVALLPQGGQVVAGSARISTQSVDQMVIDQSSQRAVIDWQSFNIGAGNTVQFVQPSSTAQALNRVVGLTGTTQILGKLTANGQVFIVNPQGVVFGKGAVVDTAALLASTHDIAPSAFMAHGASLLLSGGSNGTGLVENEGKLRTTPGGWVALVGDQVKNGGSIDAPAGTVALAAGAEATLALANGQLVSLKLDRAAGKAQVIESGTILANGAAGKGIGRVLISADTAQSLLDQAINITGVVQAGGGTANRGGQIAVDGGTNGAVSLQNATLTVASAKGVGGQVSVTGKQVTLYGAHLNASGAAGGGTILVGGGAHGDAASVADAAATTVDARSSIDASATGNGNGGQVVLWSNDRTNFGGTILSGGGVSGGNGGNVEVSSHGSVSFTGSVDTRAPRGNTGSLLLDPTNINIANGAAGAPNSTTVDGSSGNATITDGEISTELAITGVTLSATSNITDTAGTVVSGTNAANPLTLCATNITLYGSYNVSGGVVLNGSGAIVFDAARIDTGASNFTARANTVAFSGNTVIGGASPSISGVNGAYAVTFSSGSVTNLSASSGNILVSGNGAGGILMNTGSTINVVGNGTFTGTAAGWDGGISVGCGTNDIVSALVVINSSGGSLTLNGTNTHGDGIGISDTVNLSGNQTWLGTGTCGGRGIDFGGLCNIQTTPYIIDVLSGTVAFSSPGSQNAFQSSSTTQNISAASGAVVTLDATMGSPALNITGPGTVVFDANNSNLSGSIVLSGGTLQVGNGGPNGTLGTASVTDDGTVTFNLSGNLTVSQAIAGTGNLTQAGAGTLILAANNSYTGTTIIAGTLQVGNGGTSGTLGTANVTDDGNLTFNLSGNLTVPQAITGTGNLAQAGAGALTLASNNTYTGATVVSAGTLQIGNGAAAGSLGTGAINVTGAALAFDLTGNSTQGNASQLVLNDATLTVLSGNMTLAGSSTGGTAVIISGNNTMNASGGSLTILGNGIDGGSVAIDFGAGALINGMGNVSLLGNLTGATGGGRRSFIFNGNATFDALAGGGISLTSAINGVAPDVAFLQNATGVLATSGNVAFNVQSNADVWEDAFDRIDGVGIWNFSSANGALTINALTAQPGYGSFNLNSSQPLVLNAEAGGSITVNGVGIYASNTSITAGVGTVLINANVRLTGNLAIDGGAGDMTLAGVISGAYELTQNSTGTTALTGTNSYGGTSISAGTLQVGTGGATGTLGTGSVADGSDLTFDLSGNLTVSQAITGTGNLTQAGTGTLTLTSNNTYTGATDVSAGTLQVGSGGTTGTLGTGTVIDDSALVVNYGAAVSLSALAACTSGITGSGNLTAVSTGALTIDRAVDLSGGNGAVLLAAGCATAAGDSAGGDVTLTSPVSVGAGGTVTVFSGNPSTATLEGQLAGASGTTQYKTYDADYLAAQGAVSGARNFYYRGADNVSLSATGTLASKTYDGTIGVTGGINAGAVSVSESVTDGNNISFSSLAVGSVAFGSPHVLGVDGSVVEVSFGNTAQFSVSGANWSVAGLTVGILAGNGTIAAANLTITATGQSKTYDGTASAASLATASGLASTDTLAPSALSEAYGSPHAQGTGASTLNVAAALSNASFASGSVGYITDYTVGYVAATGTITRANLTVTATAQSRAYDGTESATSLATASGLAATDSLTPAALAEAYSSPHALGTGSSTLNITAALSNASFASGSVGYVTDYIVGYVPATGTITPETLTLAATSQTKGYDGTDSAASLATASGLATTDTLTPAALAETYGSPHALGTGASTLNVAAALSNASFASGSIGYVTDYTVGYVTAAGTITPANLTVTATGQTKTYDGTDSAASLATTSGLASTDALTPAALAEAYSSPHALGTGGSTLNVTAALSNASFASGSVGYVTDYTVGYIPAVGTVTPGNLTVTATGQTKTYDGTDSAASLATTSGLASTDTLSPAALAETYGTPHALGTGASTLNVAAALSNASLASGSVGYVTDYTVDYLPAAGTITPANLTVTATGQSKTYNGTDSAASLATASGLANTDTLSPAALAETYGSPHALGTGASTLNVAAALSNASFASGSIGYVTDYTVGYVTAAGTITPASLTLSAISQTKTYDGTKSATSLATVSGLASVDSLTPAAAVEAYSSPHAVGVDGSTLNVAAALSNASLASGSIGYITDYNVAYVTAAGTITPANLTITATGQSRAYDGTDGATSLATISGLAATDALTSAAVAETYASPHALGTGGSTLNVAAALSNASFASGSVGHITDYNVGYVTAAGTITPANLTVTATGQSRTYDGTDGATSLATASGLASTDALTPAALAEAYSSPHALGTGGSTLNVAAALSNASFASGSAGYITDYDVNYVTAAGTITPANLTVTATGQSRTYDGTDGATSLATASGLASTDALTPAALAEAYSSPHALGMGSSTLNVTAALSNASFGSGSVGYVSDYTVDYVPAAGTITPANLTVTATGQSKTYDGTDSAASLATASGLAPTDALTSAAVAETYASPHALGTGGSTLNVAAALSNASFASGSAGYITDYDVNYVTAAGTITPANLTVAATGQSRTYDGTESASRLATVSGLASTDSLTNAAVAEAYASPHALGTDGSILNIATALSNASFASGSVGYITDYTVAYIAAKGTITPAVLDVASGSNFTLYDIPVTTLANISGNVQAGQGYVSDYSPNVINNGNLNFAGPDDATLASLTGAGNLVVDADQMLTVTGAFTQMTTTVDGRLVAGQTQQVQSGISAVEWRRRATTNDTEVTPGLSGILVADGALCIDPKQDSKVCE